VIPALREFARGVRYAVGGFDLVFRPGIRVYAFIPLLINVLLFAGVVIYGARLLHDFIHAWLPGAWEWLSWLIWPLFAFIAFTVVFFCFTLVANLVAAPFNGLLAGAAEASLTGVNATDSGDMIRLPREIAGAIVSELRKFAYFIVRVIPLLLLFFLPGLQFFAPFLWFLFGSWMLALEYLDFPMGNHGIAFPDQRDAARAERSLALGFGAGALVLAMIPVINFMAIPVTVCGATRLWLERIRRR